MSSTESRPNLTIVGVIGGIASGKSNFTNILQSLGAERIDADALAHVVLKRPLVIRMLTQLIGTAILNSRGDVDRAKLSQIAFPLDGSRSEALKHLEDVTHPLIHAEAVRRLSALAEAGDSKSVVIVAPLLLEAGWAPMCDAIVFIDTPEHVRIARAAARGWSEKHFRAREAAQLPLDEKRIRATHTISGESSTEQLLAFGERLLNANAANKNSENSN